MDLIFGFDVVRSPIEESFSYAVKYSFSHLEIDLIRRHSFIETFNSDRITKLKKLSEDHCITLSLHTPFTINPSDKIPVIRDANIEYLKRCVLIANKLNATHITTHVGYCLGVKPSKKKALKRLVVNLRKLLEYCQKFEVNLALENVNPMPQESEFFYLGDNIEECKFIFSELDSPLLSLCLDIGHANTNEGPLAYIKNFGKKIISLHYHDNNGITDDHLDVGQGTVPWKEVVESIKAIKL